MDNDNNIIPVKNWTKITNLADGVSGLPLPFVKDIFLLKCKVVGLNYVPDIEKKTALIKEDSLLVLQREATNHYDKRAILVLYNNEKIGYIPKTENMIISRLMDGGKIIFAKVENKENLYSMDKTLRINLNIKIFMKDL